MALPICATITDLDLFARALGTPALLGMLLWRIGYATQDTLLKAIIAGVLPEGRRNFAFGLFYVEYGLDWLTGSVATGLLYQRSRIALIV